MASSKKTAAGCGNIRKKIIRRVGKEYEYREARYTVNSYLATIKNIHGVPHKLNEHQIAAFLKGIKGSKNPPLMFRTF